MPGRSRKMVMLGYYHAIRRHLNKIRQYIGHSKNTVPLSDIMKMVMNGGITDENVTEVIKTSLSVVKMN